MKKAVLFSCILSLFSMVYTQNCKSYSYWVNQAELAMCDTNWDKVNHCYDSAFAIQRPYYKDILNAFLTNIYYTSDKERIIKYHHDIYACGGNNIANWLISTDTLTYKLLKQLEDTIPTVYDPSLVKLLDSVIDVDQRYHINRVPLKEHEKAYKKNKKTIIKLLKKYPEIGIYTAGFDYEMKLALPCTHYMQVGDASIHHIMKRKVMKGQVDPNLYVLIEESAVGPNNNTTFTNNYGNAFYQIGDVLFYTEPDNIEQINQNRRSIGIEETFEDYVKKVIWQYTTGRYKIHGATRIETDDNEAAIASRKAEIDKEHQQGNFKRSYYSIL